MIYLNRIAPTLHTDELPVITPDEIKELLTLSMSGILNIYESKFKHSLTEFDVVYATKLYSGSKIEVQVQQNKFSDNHDILVTGYMSDAEYEDFICTVLNDEVRHAIRNIGGRFVFNKSDTGEYTLLYAVDKNNVLLMPVDLKFLMGDTVSIAATHRIIISDLFIKCSTETHDGYIISTDDKLLAKIDLKKYAIPENPSVQALIKSGIVAPVDISNSANIYFKIERDNERNRILEQITQDIGFTNISKATETEVDDLIEYYKRGKTHVTGTTNYDIRFMRLAREFATWSKDPSTQLGAVAISDDTKIVLSQGYNGFPRGIKDDYRLYIRTLKYQHTVHAEMNVIYNASQNGVPLKGSTLYVFGLPVCAECATAVVQVGFKRVVICDTKNDERWNESFKLSLAKFNEAGIIVDFVKMEELD